MNSKRLLIVYPYAFGTGWGGSSPRILQVARGLSDRCWDVTLLRCKQSNEAELEKVVAAFPGRVFTTAFNGPYPAWFNHKGLRQVFQLALRTTGRSVDGDPVGVLVKRLVRFAQSEPSFPKPNLIWGITVGFLAGPVAAQRLGEYFECPYVVEFQDPVPHPGRPPLTGEQHQAFDACLSKAALAITSTRGISAKVETDFPRTRGKARTVYLSYDGNPSRVAASATNPERLLLLHAGVLYGGSGRNANTLVRGMAEACRRQPEFRGRMILRLLGGGAGGEEACGIARELGIGDMVEVRPQLPQDECNLEMDRADVLVAIKFDDPQYDLQIPGKIFQYLSRGKPILGLMRETEAAQILRESGLGVVRTNADISGIAEALLELWTHRRSLATRFQPNWNFIQSFSVDAMAAQLDAELTPLLGASPVRVEAHARAH